MSGEAINVRYRNQELTAYVSGTPVMVDKETPCDYCQGKGLWQNLVIVHEIHDSRGLIIDINSGFGKKVVEHISRLMLAERVWCEGECEKKFYDEYQEIP
jgi:hypothetical protein